MTEREASAAAFHHSESHQLYLGYVNGDVSIFDLRKLEAPLESKTDLHSKAVRQIVVEAVGVASGGDDGVARVWNSETVVQHKDFVRGLLFRDNQLISASWDKTLQYNALK